DLGQHDGGVRVLAFGGRHQHGAQVGAEGPVGRDLWVDLTQAGAHRDQARELLVQLGLAVMASSTAVGLVKSRSEALRTRTVKDGWAHVRTSPRFRQTLPVIPALTARAARGYGQWSNPVTVSDTNHPTLWLNPSGSRRASARTARYCSALIAPSFLPMACAVSATEKPCRNRRTMHSCCSGLSCLTAASNSTFVMWSTTAASGLPSRPRSSRSA